MESPERCRSCCLAFLLFPLLFAPGAPTVEALGSVSSSEAEAVETGADDAGADDRVVLDEILVTAEKEERNLQEVPLAITASSAATFDRFAEDDSETFSQELRWASNNHADTVSWLAGLFYFPDDAYRLERWDLGEDNVL